jgi:hypothetical protein
LLRWLTREELRQAPVLCPGLCGRHGSNSGEPRGSTGQHAGAGACAAAREGVGVLDWRRKRTEEEARWQPLMATGGRARRGGGGTHTRGGGQWLFIGGLRLCFEDTTGVRGGLARRHVGHRPAADMAGIRHGWRRARHAAGVVPQCSVRVWPRGAGPQCVRPRARGQQARRRRVVECHVVGARAWARCAGARCCVTCPFSFHLTLFDREKLQKFE